MLTFKDSSGNQLHYVVSGSLSSSDLRHYYKTVRTHYVQFGRLDLLAEVTDFTGYATFGAVRLFLRHEPSLLWRVKSYTLSGGPAWLRRTIRVLGCLAPWVRVRTI